MPTAGFPPEGATVGPAAPNSRYVASNVPIGDYIVPPQGANPRYAVSDVADHAFTDSPVGAWSPSLRTSTEGTPDAQRNQAVPLRDYRPGPRQAPQEWWTGPGGPGREVQTRHTQFEYQDADGWEVTRGDPNRKRAAPDIRRTPPTPSRVTDKLAPSSYTFTRPFDQNVERNFNGQHFSMADHRRTYEIYGMAPVYSRRNTYRADPAPWDADIVDQVPPFNPVGARIMATEVPDSAGSAWRLM